MSAFLFLFIGVLTVVLIIEGIDEFILATREPHPPRRPDDWPKGTDCSEEDVPIVDPDDRLDY